jgi:hypothetical protein
MLRSLKKSRALSIAIALAATAAALWAYGTQPRSVARAPALTPIVDGKTIDFSDGSPAIRDSAADKAAIDAAVKDMDAASKDVTFPADPPPKT